MESPEVSQQRRWELHSIEKTVLAQSISEVYELACEHERIRLFLLNENQGEQGRRLVEPKTVKANGWLGEQDPANMYTLTINTDGSGGFRAYIRGDKKEQPKRASAYVGRREDDSLYTEPLSNANDLNLQEIQEIVSSAAEDVERQISELIDVDVT